MPIGYGQDILATVENKSKFTKIHLVFVIVILLSVLGLGFAILSGSPETPRAAVSTTETVRSPVVHIGESVSVYPGHLISVSSDLVVTVQNNGSEVFDVSKYVYSCVLSDGTIQGGVSIKTWGMTLQPGEKYSFQVEMPPGSTLVIENLVDEDLVEIARWQP